MFAAHRLCVAFGFAVLASGALAAPPDLHDVKTQLKSYIDQGDYDRDLVAADADAQAYLDAHAAGVANAAIVLDIDETSLSNREQIRADDFAYMPGWYCQASSPVGFCAALAWNALERAPAIAPTLALFNDAKVRGVAIFFITGRREAERDVTEGNLRKAGYAGWTKIILRPEQDTFASAQAYKTAQRQALAGQYRVLVNVGDQQSDIDGGYADHAVKLPNPFYFIP